MSKEPSDLKAIENKIRILQILVAGLLLKEDPRPNIEKLERLIGIRKGILSELFPQRERTKTKN